MPRFQWLMRAGARSRRHRNVSGHSSGGPRGAFQSVVESKAEFRRRAARRLPISRGKQSRIPDKRRRPLAHAPDVMLRSPLSPFHGPSMSAALRPHPILAAVAAGARAAGLKLKKRLLD
ncbi:hypothetical protein WM24_07460 [Burkholderia ubonensis]|nr:hypothetical protein WM24_07460 [Burkholderia ubonensis]